MRQFALAVSTRVEDLRSRSSIGRVGEHPVFAVDDERLDCPFGALVVDLQMAAFDITFEFLPLPETITMALPLLISVAPAKLTCPARTLTWIRGFRADVGCWFLSGIKKS